MAGDLGFLPRRQLLVDLDQCLVGTAGKAIDLFIDRHGMVGCRQRLEFDNLAFEIGYWLFKIEIRLHPTARLGSFLATC